MLPPGRSATKIGCSARLLSRYWHLSLVFVVMAADAPSIPWVEKYRPNSLDELISHKEIINTIETLIEKQQMPHLLLYGPPGTGKTSTILACAKKLFGPSYKSMILEVRTTCRGGGGGGGEGARVEEGEGSNGRGSARHERVAECVLNVANSERR